MDCSFVSTTNTAIQSFNAFHLESTLILGEVRAMEVLPPCRTFSSIPKSSPRHVRWLHHDSNRGFTRLDLLGSLAAAALVLGILLPATAGMRPANGQAQCISNLRRLMLASQLYARDNSEYLPHPTWGGDLTGPDGWAYATENKGRLPNLPRTPTPTKRDTQLPFRQIGQLWNYIQSGSAYECPEDLIVTQSNLDRLRGRPVQITSYTFNGMIAGYATPQQLSGGLTYKISRFLPNDIFANEPNEAEGFFFNDAGFNTYEAASYATTRHGGFLRDPRTPTNDDLQEGGSNVGCLDGSAEFLSQSGYAAERNTPTATQRTRFHCFPGK